MASDKLVDFDHVTDYISLEAAVKEFYVQQSYYDAEWGAKRFATEDVQDILQSIPAADVVEVVRCRDCKHRPVVTDESHPYGFGLACPKEGAYQDVTCPYLCDDGYYNRMPADGWYCADGERRADNG